MSKPKPKTKAERAHTNAIAKYALGAEAYPQRLGVSLSEAMGRRVRRFAHASREVSGTQVTYQLATHILICAGLEALETPIVQEAGRRWAEANEAE